MKGLDRASLRADVVEMLALATYVPGLFRGI